MTGKRKLDYKSVDSVVGVKLGYLLKKLSLSAVVLKPYEGGGEATLAAGLDLVCHIGFRTSVVTHEYRGEVGARVVRPQP